MSLKKIILSISYILICSQALATKYEPPFITTPIPNWAFIEVNIVKACLKNNYKIKSVIQEKKQVICFKEEVIHEKYLERNIKITGGVSMIGHVINTEQWMEVEDNNGDPRIIIINQEANKKYIDDILNDIKLN